MVGEGNGKPGAAHAGTAAERSAHQMMPSQICTMWTSTPPYRKVMKINIFTVLTLSDIGQKGLEKSRHPVIKKSKHQKQWPVLKRDAFCHSSASQYCPHSSVYLSKHFSA